MEEGQSKDGGAEERDYTDRGKGTVSYYAVDYGEGDAGGEADDGEGAEGCERGIGLHGFWADKNLGDEVREDHVKRD